MTDLIIKSGVQEALDDNHISADLYDALDEEVEALLDEAARRAEANDRQTVMAQDL
jgi:histone H3/H4